MRIGVVGTGKLGNIHLKCLNHTDFETIGVFDLDQGRAQKAAETFQIKSFDTYDHLLSKVDVVVVVADTQSHFELAKQALEQHKHVFIEKPVTATLELALSLQSLIQEKSSLKVQIGHVERYNPAFSSALESVNNPRFIECHRLANFNPRGNDVSVILDLMIHDLDILLSVVNAEISEVRSNGVNIISKTADICNARIEFANGCVANMTASRLSLKQMRKFRIFQSDAYIAIDFLEKTNQIIQLQNEASEASMPIETDLGEKFLNIKSQSAQSNNAIVDELNDFYQAIVNKRQTTVDIDHAVKVMKLADQIEKNLNFSESHV